jgi:type I restriction enzyme S subunit
MPKVNREALGAFPVPVPCLGEQQEIARFCEDIDQDHRKTADKVRDSIKRLEEYRSAQITAAVTGKIAGLQ